MYNRAIQPTATDKTFAIRYLRSILVLMSAPISHGTVLNFTMNNGSTLIRSELQTIANALVRRAQRQGFIVPSEVKQELSDAGHEESRWKEAIELVRDSLHYKQGRYYHLSAEMLQQANTGPQQVIQAILSQPQSSLYENRRQEERRSVSLTIPVYDESDGQSFTVFSRDLSSTGIRLLANRSLLGRKLRLSLPLPDTESEPICVSVRILWTSVVADGIYENGGTFPDEELS